MKQKGISKLRYVRRIKELEKELEETGKELNHWVDEKNKLEKEL